MALRATKQRKEGKALGWGFYRSGGARLEPWPPIMELNHGVQSLRSKRQDRPRRHGISHVTKLAWMRWAAEEVY
ncbi:hypothetical protein E2562_006485 [Oryza meyeriana var. granulata]|uniref:Uncharacterized protein n=1 Tax=Oryza meyeriana var. granulata TaxID=110450 RepID=A0A6G1CQE2_9ORYZ|nr:hypothetical protein E2562_006485 [Oryza meyeriana var. granulata]